MDDYWLHYDNLMSGDRSHTMYPLLSFYYIYLKANNHSLSYPVLPDCERAVNVLRFLRFVFTETSIRKTVLNHLEWPYAMPIDVLYARFVSMIRDEPKSCRQGNLTYSTWNKVKQ